jgi:hypothetical protein
VRVALFAAALVAVAGVFSPELVRGALATSAGALCEATPFLLAGSASAALFRRGHLVVYFGCGCARGPSARSLPAAAATCLVFGPWVAAARFIAAMVVARFTSPKCDRAKDSHAMPSLLEGLNELLTAASFAGAASQFVALFDLAKLPPPLAALTGIALGFAAAPCGLGSVAIAGALRASAPFCAAGFLCIAGIFDLRSLTVARARRTMPDATAYLMLGCALGIVAARHGDALVHPALTPVYACCAVVSLTSAVVYRRFHNLPARLAPAILLAGAVLAAPPPPYRATETTMTDLFPGERLAFAGRLVRDGDAVALVRYAVTCCRADAAPIVVRLDRAPRAQTGGWVRAEGAIASVRGEFRLVAQRVDAIAPPADPFVYR